MARPGQQITADLLAEYAGKPRPVDRLVIGDGAEHPHLHLGEAECLFTQTSCRLNSIRELRLGPEQNSDKFILSQTVVKPVGATPNHIKPPWQRNGAQFYHQRALMLADHHQNQLLVV